MSRPEPSISDEYDTAQHLSVRADVVPSSKTAAQQVHIRQDVRITAIRIPLSQLLVLSTKLAIALVPLVALSTVAFFAGRWWFTQWLAS